MFNAPNLGLILRQLHFSDTAIINIDIISDYDVILLNSLKKLNGSSVVECLTRDQGAPSSSFTGVTVLCP